MVSFARLLAAASDTSESAQGASRTLQQSPSSVHWLEEHALPAEAFALAFAKIGSDVALPESLRRSNESDTPSDIPHAQRTSHPAIPVEKLLSDLGPDSTAPQNINYLKHTLARFKDLNEADIARSFVRIFGAMREQIDADAEVMPIHQLFCIFTEEFTEDPECCQDAKDVLSAAPNGFQWNFDVFVSALIEVTSDAKISIDWNEVIRALDCPELHTVLDLQAFVSIAKSYAAGTRGLRIPSSCFVKPWRNISAQTAILTAALSKPELVDWECIDSFPGATAEELSSPYCRLDLVGTLIDLNATHLLNLAVVSHPSLMVMSLSRCRPSANGALMRSHLVQLLTKHISSFPASAQIMRRLWHFIPALIAGALLAMWRKDTKSVGLVVDIGIDLLCLPEILSPTMPLEFVFHVGMLAYKLQSFPWETVLLKYFAANGPASLASWTRRVTEVLLSQRGIETFSVDAVRIMFRAMFSVLSSLRQQDSPVGFSQLTDEVKQLHDAFVLHDPRLADLQASADLGNNTVLIGSAPGAERLTAAGNARNYQAHLLEGTRSFLDTTDARFTDTEEQQFSKDVEDDVNRRFHDLYKGSLTIEQSVELLRTLQVSENTRDRKVFACMIHTLFDEYRFFKNYPDKELKITGILFGALVQYSIFVGDSLQIALERVLDALQQGEKRSMNLAQRRPHDAKDEEITRMTKFGLCALDRFRKRLPEWPQYCTRVLELSHLRLIAPELMREIESLAYGVVTSPPQSFVTNQEQKVTRRPEIPLEGSPNIAVRNGAPSYGPASPRHRTSPTLEAVAKRNQSFAIPDAVTCEKISFIFNNLSASNFEEKKGQLVEFLQPNHFPFFIDYVVVKRALVEPNHHELYIDFLDMLSSHIPNLFQLIVNKSFENAKALLASDKIVINTNDRIVLRTLGAWIGLLTLGRNKPILSRDLDLKKLCLEAYTRGRLTPVVPFVAKVLQGSKESKVFSQSNPWLKGVLSLLQEISQVEDLKLNIKFELPSLLITLKIDSEDVPASNLLKNVEQPSRNNPDRRRSPQRSPRSPSASPDMRAAYTNIRSAAENAPNISLGIDTSGMPPSSMGVGLGGVQSTVLSSHMGINVHVPSATSMNSVLGSDAVSDLPSVLAGVPRPIHTGGSASTSAIHHSVGSSGGLMAQSQPSVANGSDALLLPNFSHLVTINSSIGIFQASPSLKSLLPIAIDRALKDIIQPVVERSCAIASLTTRELTLKDFENENNMAKVRRAALQMVQQLAGSLALVTCKEPLRVSMGNHVRNILTSSAVSVDSVVIDQAASLVCAANLDLGCHIIEKAAKDKAARDLNEVIASAFSAARRPTPSVYAPPGPPGPEVFRVYADFSRLPRGNGTDESRVAAQQQVYQSSTSMGVLGNSAMSQQINMAPLGTTHPLDIAAAPTSHGLMSSERLQEARYAAEREIQYAANLRYTAQTPLHSELPAPATEVIGQGAPIGNRTTGQTTARPAENIPQHSGRSPLAMAPPASMAAAMAKALQSLNNSQSSRLQQSNQVSASLHSSSEKALSTPQVLEKFNMVYGQLTAAISEVTNIPSIQDIKLVDLPADHSIHHLWAEIPAAVKRSVTADEASMAVAQKVFKGLYEVDSTLHREVHVAILDGLRESCRRLSKELVIWLAYSEESKKLNRDCILSLLKAKSLINVTGYDELLSKAMDGGRNTKALDFAAFLVRCAVIDEQFVTSAEFALTLDTMAKIGRRPSAPSLPSTPGGLTALVEEARRAPNRSSFLSASGDSSDSQTASTVKVHKEIEHADPVGSRDLVTGILTEWQRLMVAEVQQQHVVTTFLGHIRSKTMNNEESRERFCRLAVEMVVAVTTTALRSNGEAGDVASDIAHAPYTAVESTVRLVSALCLAESSHSSDSQARSSVILGSFLTSLVKNILRNSDSGEVRPQYQLFVGLLNEISNGVPPSVPDERGAGANAVSDYGLESIDDSVSWSRSQAFAFLDGKGEGLTSFARRVSNSGDGLLGGDGIISIANYGVLALFVGALKACGPRAAPGFAFCWLQLISNRNILPRLLNAPQENSWSLFRQLLVSMINFLSPHVHCPPYLLKDHIKHLYRGTLRVLLVLLHDFPKFLVDYHFALCDAIPHSCIQMRNLVLAAFPKDMRLPDPFRPELQASQLPEMALEPRILSDYISVLERTGVKSATDSILHNSPYRGPPARISDVVSGLMVDNESGVGGSKYNIDAIYAFVFYVGRDALSRSGHSTALTGSELHTKFLQGVLIDMDSEGQYHMLNVIANQLRYPNSHTNYFSCLLLYLFRESPNDNVKEQITRVLVERLIANRPHPWGLLITFIDLIKNPVYNFWRHGFVRCAPQIENLFENVARFCIGPALQHNPVPAV